MTSDNELSRGGLWEGISVVALLNVFLRHWRILVAVPIAVTVFAIGAAILWRPYEAEASFIADTGTTPLSQLSGLASQFGVQLSAQGGLPAQFYADLLSSRRVLAAAAQTKYAFLDSDSQPHSGTYITLRGIDEDTPQKTLLKAIKDLSKHMDVSLSTESGLITLEVTTPWPKLSEAIARRILDLVNEFNVLIRSTQSREERKFIGGRLSSARTEMDSVAAVLQTFLENNRTRGESPRLQLEEDGLRRDLALRQQTVASLTEAYEEARIAEVRDTPVITVVDVPEESATAVPSLTIVAVLAVIGGGLMAVVWVVLAQFVEQQGRVDAEAVEELKTRVGTVTRWFVRSRR